MTLTEPDPIQSSGKTTHTTTGRAATVHCDTYWELDAQSAYKYVNLLEANTVPGIASKLFIRPHSTQNHLKHALSCLHTLVSHTESPETCTLLSTHTCQSHRITWNMHSLVYTHLSVTQNHLKHVLFCLHTLVVSHTESPKTCAFLSTYTCSQIHRITWNKCSLVYTHL